jgi:alkanesulfonate monooxygenase SsuD/methylene tetrahydromethanopterin reductase-like flavin-dependent oxidoreductase (luciferase family)
VSASEPKYPAGMRLGVVILPELTWSAAQRLWRRAEELGFDHAWTYDHLAWRSLRDSTWFGAVPTLTAAAMATRRIRVGTLVASPNFRHPVPFATELVTLDDISDGRLTLGIGAGGDGWDATMLGQGAWSPGERGKRFAEFLELTDRLLRDPATSFEGHFYSADEARTYPGCVQRPRIPFAVAATGPKGMRLAATYGQTWVTTGDRTRAATLSAEEGAKVVGEQMDRLDETCLELGRDPASLRRLVLSGPSLDPGLASIEAFRHTTGRYAEVGVTDFVVHWPRPHAPFAGDVASFERILSRRLG